jgi:hypothetical protein
MAKMGSEDYAAAAPFWQVFSPRIRSLVAIDNGLHPMLESSPAKM